MDRWATTMTLLLLLLLASGPGPVAADSPGDNGQESQFQESASHDAHHIEVFHTAADPVTVPPGYPVTVYVVDGAQQVEQALTAQVIGIGKGGVTNQTTLRRHAEQQVQRIDPEVAHAVVNSYQGLQRARALGIDRLPAIVFDKGTAVVYGVRDLAEALAQYQQWRAMR